jgi:hypothetical protein
MTEFNDIANAAESWRRVSSPLSSMLLSTAAMHAVRAAVVVFAFCSKLQ